MTTLGERHHCADMDMDHQVTKKENGPDHATWFRKAEESRRATRIIADPLNIKP
jgi:hypothetical protein